MTFDLHWSKVSNAQFLAAQIAAIGRGSVIATAAWNRWCAVASEARIANKQLVRCTTALANRQRHNELLRAAMWCCWTGRRETCLRRQGAARCLGVGLRSVQGRLWREVCCRTAAMTPSAGRVAAGPKGGNDSASTKSSRSLLKCEPTIAKRVSTSAMSFCRSGRKECETPVVRHERDDCIIDFRIRESETLSYPTTLTPWPIRQLPAPPAALEAAIVAAMRRWLWRVWQVWRTCVPLESPLLQAPGTELVHATAIALASTFRTGRQRRRMLVVALSAWRGAVSGARVWHNKAIGHGPIWLGPWWSSKELVQSEC